jgi:uncharacterized protein with von Willebrand factor type A (vWA) domain
MLIDFFFTLKDAKIPVTIKEFLTLLEAMEKNVIGPSMDDFYYVARLTMVKDEANFDKFDRAFAQYFKGINAAFDTNGAIPLDWLIKRMERELSDEQKAQLEKFGYDKLMDRLNELLKEQKERHEGGSKWIGTGGTSPFGNGGSNPEGIRIGGKGGNRTAVKVWEQRSYKDYDAERELGTRNIKVALRRLRKFARDGADEELALDATIRATASNAGWLDIKMQPERKNKIKVLMLLTSAAPWTTTSNAPRSCSRRPRPNSRIWSSSTSTTASMTICGRTTGAAMRSASRPGTCCASIRPIPS